MGREQYNRSMNPPSPASADRANEIEPACPLIAVKALIKRSDGKILLVRRPPAPDSGNPLKYNPPGGVVEPGEGLLAALRRETFEETRLEIEIDGICAVSEWYVPYRRRNYVGVFFACRLADELSPIILDRENFEYVWADELQCSKLDIMNGSRKAVSSFLAVHRVAKLPLFDF